MVGIVVVSHSARLAEGVVELAREMGGGEVAVEAAGGVDEPGSPLGTDAGLIADALRRAGSGDGVVVLMDIGSALLSAETALDLLEGSEEEIVLSAAPLVEGAVAAAAAARAGASVDEVAREARGALAAKVEHLGAPDDGGLGDPAQEGTGNGDALELRATVDNPMGLHARPAARLVEAAARFEAEVTIANATTGRGPVSARSLTSIATLGVRRGHDVVLRARGPQAAEAVAALEGLVEDGFGEGGRSGGGPGPGARREQRAGSDVAASPPAAAGALAGVPASPGIGIGEAHVLGGPAPDVPAEPSG
ncbi:MAG TPA: dihydroxyacetone kinase phosphoryl donor subunit DhaM, partial [Actinomycetota bacterium]|nr:dihydroxyacetone kinase phosphoryl donor subunit DhaM [Actinomycetota bacterium]